MLSLDGGRQARSGGWGNGGTDRQVGTGAGGGGGGVKEGHVRAVLCYAKL